MSQQAKAHLQLLRELRKDLDYKIGGNAESSRAFLDRQIALHSMDPNDEVTQNLAKQRAALHLAACRGLPFTYGANCELPDGTRRSEGDIVDARAEVSKIRTFVIQNFVSAESSAAEFFQEVNFADNEAPFWENQTKWETKFSLVGQDGALIGRQGQIVKEFAHTQLPGPWELEATPQRYKLRDLLRGDVAEEQRALIDIARDQKLNLDARLWTTLKARSATAGAATISPFKFDGKRCNRTMNLHSSIDAGNLPATNDLDLADAPGYVSYTGNIDKMFLDYVVRYGAQFAGTDMGPLRVQGIYFPSKVNLSVVTTVTQSTNDKTSTVSGQIIQKGLIGELYGEQFAYRPLATLPNDHKYAYVRFNKPVGILGFKPGLDRAVDERNELANFGTIGAVKVWTAGVPEQWRPNIVRVRFRS